MTPARTPVTVLTGFLGSGKSTLIRHLLRAPHGVRIAVIENEFAAENIDADLIVGSGDETIVQLTNGCVCCTIRDDLRVALTTLAAQRAAGQIAFDRVVIETTGLADPGPVAQTFFLDDAVVAHYRPDAIVTTVDAKFGLGQLTTRREAQLQAGYADLILVTKADLVTNDERAALATRLTAINPRAPQRDVAFGALPAAALFDLGGFNLTGDLDLADPHDGCAGDACDHPHHQHGGVDSFVFRADRPFDPGRLQQFLAATVKHYGPQLLRYKGILAVAGLTRRVILQGVHQLTSSDLGAPWPDGVVGQTRLVFIGVELPKAILRRSLEQCLVRDA